MHSLINKLVVLYKELNFPFPMIMWGLGILVLICCSVMFYGYGMDIPFLFLIVIGFLLGGDVMRLAMYVNLRIRGKRDLDSPITLVIISVPTGYFIWFIVDVIH